MSRPSAIDCLLVPGSQPSAIRMEPTSHATDSASGISAPARSM
jgi:hypothetical protein